MDKRLFITICVAARTAARWDNMDEYNLDKKYKSFKIPDRRQTQEDGVGQSLSHTKANTPVSLNEGLFYEIDYDSCSIPGAGKFVLRSQKIEPPEKDEIQEFFHQMRDIARENRSLFFTSSKFYDKKVQQENSKIFYKQGMFMKDFTDQYTKSVPYSSYFPYYQMMGNEQLRSYFTWRTEVRKGNVTDTSLSYAFLYIYELLNNIGVDDPQEGLDKLMSFWNAFSVYNKTIDKYVLRWLKDYHIYYELPQSFKEFIDKNNLIMHYPKMADTDNNFDLFCAISKYDVRKSAFYIDDKIKLITDCFYFINNKLRQVFIENGIHFDECIFQPTKKMSVWTPFKEALFYQWMKQPDRQIVLSENEIYICRQNNWAFSTVITTESGRQLIGYVMKQMESVLRKVTKYKFMLSANINTVTHVVIGKLLEAGLSLESIVTDAVMEFYREATKTVVKVDHGALSRIRQEALTTQEKLIVQEQDELVFTAPTPLNFSQPALKDVSSIPMPGEESVSLSDSWEGLKNALSEIETKALLILMLGESDIKQFADEHGVMLEVLIDGINEKAMDFVGDNLLDDEFTIYDDYIEQVKEMVE